MSVRIAVLLALLWVGIVGYHVVNLIVRALSL